MKNYYAIVTFGSPTQGRVRSFYRSQDSAVKDAREVQGGSCTNVRVLLCSSQKQAREADISDPYPVVWQS
ncbi:MAG: hypothetical protein GF334_12815 [Candidatus Altiarchaeales archaeon]|nr:hypothetical protein [Candidatus Altiarchaeales archaeon]